MLQLVVVPSEHFPLTVQPCQLVLQGRDGEKVLVGGELELVVLGGQVLQGLG